MNLFVWLSNHANEDLKATIPRVITFVIGFKITPHFISLFSSYLFIITNSVRKYVKTSSLLKILGMLKEV